MTNAMNAIANQVIHNSGRSGRNAGWPYFDGTFRDYPAFKRKFESFQMNYHCGTPTQELFQQFREMCLPEKIAARIKSAETMENAWIRLEAWFGDKSLFIKDLMQDIRSVTPIKDGDDERLMDYYVMLQAHIAEALNADALDMLMIPANVELMVLPLTAWEKRVWREAQGRLPAEDRSWYMDVFVNERLRYAINMVATSERHVLPKATPLHSSQRSPSSEGRGGRRRIIREERAVHDRHGEQERRPKEGSLPATEGLGPRGQMDSGLRNVPGVWRETPAWEVRRVQEAVSTAEAEGDRQQGAMSALLPAPARAELLVKGQGAQLRRRRL